MFKNTANTSSKYILNANDFKHIDIQKNSKERNSNILKAEFVSEKDPANPINLQIVNPLHEKRTSPFKKLLGKQKVAQVSITFANNRKNIRIEKISEYHCLIEEVALCIWTKARDWDFVVQADARQSEHDVFDAH